MLAVKLANRLGVQRAPGVVVVPAANVHYFRSDGWWMHEHKPDLHPKHRLREHETDAEVRAKAAAKYGLLPSDYRPYNYSSTLITSATGDYPDLGRISYAHRDPYENHSDDVMRRSYGEPVPFEWDRFRPDRITYTGLEGDMTDAGKPWFAPLFLLGSSLVVYFAYSVSVGRLGGGAFAHVSPLMPRQYPYDMKRAYPYGCATDYPITNYIFVGPDDHDKHDH